MTKKKDITIVICVLLLVLGLCCIIIGAIGCSAYNVYKLMSSENSSGTVTEAANAYKTYTNILVQMPCIFIMVFGIAIVLVAANTLNLTAPDKVKKEIEDVKSEMPLDSVITHLEKLYSLYEKGILTEEEYNAQKTATLASAMKPTKK
jgi:hypothetical protein